MARVIDLRSDTVTLPTPAMRQAIASAELGDDVFGEDPTVRRLEEMASGLMGKEAGLLTVSGTMSNLVALLTFCGRGDEAILGSESHILHYEVAGAAALGGIAYRSLANDEQGMLDPEAVAMAIRGSDIHFPRTGVVCLENTHNRRGGRALGAGDVAAIADVAQQRRTPLYVDGARIFNAAAALDTQAADLVREADAVAFSLCKGLVAPVGSVLCGSAQLIARARKMRKMVGGGMRQAGVIAAAGIVALETMRDRLVEDHATAKALARGLAQIPGIVIDPDTVETNIVIFRLDGLEVPDFQARLRQLGVLSSTSGPHRIRMVTHYGISRDDIDEALERVSTAMAVRA
ncbi:MAG: GntG family PLP-dependent aldolase [Dehalococcoidia bacterium]